MGVLLSLILFLARTSTPRIPTLSIDPDAAGGKRKLINILNKPVKQCPQLKILRVNMSIYFGSINHIQNRIGQIVENERIHYILIVGDSINFMDLAGAEGLIAEHQRLKAVGGGLYFSSLNACVYEFAARNDFIRKIGAKNFFDSTREAISGIYTRLDPEVCKTCPALIFEECW
jgi:SulP family sulfate permease